MLNRKGQAVETMVTILVFAVIGISAFVGTLETLTEEATETNTVTNETINITNNTVQSLAQDNIVANSQTITNANGNTTLTEGSNYTMDDETGTVTFTNVNNTQAGTDGRASYQWRNANFVDNAGTRNILGILPELGALFVFISIFFLTGL